jgi:hypothetical protein
MLVLTKIRTIKTQVMKNAKILLIGSFLSLLASSCYTEVILEDVFVEDTPVNTGQLLQSYDLWYVDINATRGNGEVPFLQRAFTLSFNNGRMFANNNMAGFGKTGNGLGIPVGYYDAGGGVLEIDHDVDGLWILDVYVLNNSTLELYDRRSDTSYYVDGYQRSGFDYDRLFYENIEYLLQEYEVWEKTFVSETGAINDFDEENFLQFYEGNLGTVFRSSIDLSGTPVSAIRWDYEGIYEVYDVQNDETLKTLTLDYSFMGNDYFELYVINDRTIELYHPDSGTVYEFQGRGYIQFMKEEAADVSRKRVKTANPVMNVVRKRK